MRLPTTIGSFTAAMDQVLAVRNSVVVLEGEGMETAVPSALEVNALLSAGRNGISSLCVDSAVAGLRIRTQRSDVRLVVSMDGGMIVAAPQVRMRGSWADVSPAAAVCADHIVIQNEWLPLDSSAMSEIARLATEHQLVWPAKISLRQYLALLTSADAAWVLVDLTASALAAERLAEDEPAPVPAVRATLYPYQTVGVRWLHRVVTEGIGGILADEMGLGKTLQIISLLQALPAALARPALIVGPTTILENWRRELARFAPALDVVVHRGPGRTGDPNRLFSYDVVVSSYETAIRDEVLFRQRTWGLVVADEAQALKNPDTERARCLKRMPKRVALAVSGTPLENRLRDLWSLADFATPGLLGGIEHFTQTYEHSPEGAALMGRVMAPLMLRRRTADVATDLPPLIDIPHYVSLSEDEVRAYESLRIERTGDASGGNRRPQLAMLTTLLQFCSHPMLVHEHDWKLEDGSKYSRLIEIVAEAVESDEKILVFASYKRMINLLSRDLAQRFGIHTFELYGETAVDDRQGVVDRFSAIPGSAILVLNPRAGGVGLNITAATQVVHYSAEWNPAVIDQATKRAHRRGQNRVVRVHRLLCADTLDEVVNERLVRKRALSEAAVVGTDGGDDDISDLLRAITISPCKTQ